MGIARTRARVRGRTARPSPRRTESDPMGTWPSCSATTWNSGARPFTCGSAGRSRAATSSSATASPAGSCTSGSPETVIARRSSGPGAAPSGPGGCVPLAARTSDGKPGPATDAAGYFNDTELRRRAETHGAFMFSRPEGPPHQSAQWHAGGVRLHGAWRPVPGGRLGQPLPAPTSTSGSTPRASWRPTRTSGCSSTATRRRTGACAVRTTWSGAAMA